MTYCSSSSSRTRGSALVSILSAVGIFGILSLAMSTLITDVWKTQNSAKSLAEANNFHEEVRAHLSNLQACLNTFGGATRNYQAPHPKVFNIDQIKNGEIPPAIVTNKYVKNTAYGSGSFDVNAMSIEYPNPQNSPIDLGEAVASITYKPLGQVLGPSVLKAREIILSVKFNAGGIMTECLPKAKMSDGIWRRVTGDPSKIFYSEGNVGVGTTSPRSILDVSGAIVSRPPSNTVGAVVDFSTGNIQYTLENCGNFVLHHMLSGGSYMFAVQGTVSNTCAFTAYSDAGATPLVVHLPAGHGATTGASHTIYSFAVAGSHVYASWIPGY